MKTFKIKHLTNLQLQTHLDPSLERTALRRPSWTSQLSASSLTSDCWNNTYTDRPYELRMYIFRKTPVHLYKFLDYPVRQSLKVKFHKKFCNNFRRLTFTSISKKPPSATSKIRPIFVPEVTRSKKQCSSFASMWMKYADV